MNGSAVTLRERLTVRRPLGPPPEPVRRNRERLCQFIRAVEGKIFAADGEIRPVLRALLGWDDETFQSFITSPLLTHSSPHTSMNGFPPMLTYPWMQRCIQMLADLQAPGRAVHLRTLVMHNNLGDLRWRPYAWWRRDRAGSIVKTALFSRSHAVRRRVLLAQPVPQIDQSDCVVTDREALALARHGRNYAYFSAIYRMAIERHAGFHLPHGTIEVPLNLLNAFTFTRECLARWAALAEETSEQRVRMIDESGELVELTREEAASRAAHTHELEKFSVICTNAQNFAQVYQFGVTTMIGAEKMALYLRPMNAEITALYDRLGWSYPFPEFIPITRIPQQFVMPRDEPSRRALHDFGLKGALSICAADHGENFGASLDGLLSQPYGELFPLAPQAAPAAGLALADEVMK
jgi:hypothetical protein